VEDLSLHVLDIAENAVAAGATRIDILITEDEKENVLLIEIKDDGKGMDEEELNRAMDPFYTTKRGKRVGLGLSFLSQAAREAEGRLDVESQPGRGTLVRATFKRSHIDRKPLGDMAQTLSALIAGYPGVRFTYAYRKGKTEHRLDTAEMWTNGFWTTVEPQQANDEKV
jgi:anti-sigma regulatory factor (Ser/Thr protein kinase)